MGNTLDEQQEQLLQQYERDNQLAAMAQANSQYPYAPTMFSGGQKQNLIEWELDFKPELESIERLLRCDILKRDASGEEHWEANPNKERIFFNELGVNDIIRNIILIVNKNKALANYNPDEINRRVKQIKHELRVLIYNQYEDYGMDNDYKINNYSFIVLSVGSIIEDVYRRAMNGETHKGLNEQRIVTQNEPIMPMSMPYQMPMQSNRKKKWYNPLSWGG